MDWKAQTPLILLAEGPSSAEDELHSLLASQGWLVKAVGSRDEALRAAAEFAPQLVLVEGDLRGAEDLVRSFCRDNGGPGVLVIGGPETADQESPMEDARLGRPLDHAALIESIRMGLAASSLRRPPRVEEESTRIWSSEQIFGDLLADLEDEPAPTEADARESDAEASPSIPDSTAAPEPAEPAAEAAPPEEPEPPSAGTAPETSAVEPAAGAVPTVDLLGRLRWESPAPTADIDAPPPELESALAERLEQTLSGVTEGALRNAAAIGSPAPQETTERDVDALLGGLLDASGGGAAAVPAPRPKEEDLLAALGDLGDLGGPGTAKPASKATSTRTDEEELVEAAESAAEQDERLPRVEILGVQAAPDYDEEELEPVVDDAMPPGHATVVTTAPLSMPEESSGAVDAETGEDAAEDGALEEPVLHLIDDDSLSGPEELGLPTDVSADLMVEPDGDSSVGEPASLEAALEADSEPEPRGESFGDYELERRIGLGGMAEVWRARRKGVEGFEKRVAIKRILPQPASNPAFVEMFIDEAKLAAELNHNHITHIYDLGKIDESFFIAMEFVDGKDLRTVLNLARSRDKPMPGELALYITACIASALDYAHKKRDPEGLRLGLVHRDVSPQNVLISTEGDIKLCDFGIAKAVSKVSTTQLGALKGKLQFMSPEQAWGREVDSRSDLFSLGCILFEMVSGESLFSGESEIAVLEEVRKCEIERRLDETPGISSPVRALLLKALAADPDDRFATAEAFGTEVEKVIANLKPKPSPKSLSSYLGNLLGREPADPEESNGLDEAAAPAGAEPAAVERPYGSSPLLEKTRPVEGASSTEASDPEGVAPEELLRMAAEDLDEAELRDADRALAGRSRRWLFWILVILLAAALGTFLWIRQVNAFGLFGDKAVPAPAISAPAAAPTTAETPAPPIARESPTVAVDRTGDDVDRAASAVGSDTIAPSATSTGDPELDERFREEIRRVEELLEASPLSQPETGDGEGLTTGSTQGGSDEP